MCEAENEKNKIRKEYILIRKNIKNKQEKSNQIFDKVITTAEYKDAKVIAIYKNISSEVDTTDLIKYSIAVGKIVVLPKAKESVLEFYKLESVNETFEKSKLGIEEPLGKIENFIDNKNIDLVIVPGICFDLEKNRLGFGKGYYDRLLKEKEFKSIGICFDEQIMERVPTNDNDMKVNMIITDKRYIL